MANMWSGKDYWKHFVGFADRSNAAGITETNLEKATTFEVISGDKRTLHGTKDKRSDTSKLQYGTNYTEQVGDSISVQKGNKSAIQSQGWSNSVMNGISFSTTSGGSFSSLGGFSFDTRLGFQTKTFIGAEIAMNESGALKVAGGIYQEVFKTSKWDNVWLEHVSLKSTATEFGAKLSRGYAAASDTIGDLCTTAGNKITRVGNSTLECLSSCFKAGNVNEDVVSVRTSGLSRTASFGQDRNASVLSDFGNLKVFG